MSTKTKRNSSGKNSKVTFGEPSYNYLLIPLGIIIAVIPLIVRYYVYENNLAQYNWFGNTPYSADFFLAYKSIIFSVISGILLLITLIKLVREGKNIKWTPMFLPLFGYGLLSLLSTVFSDYPSIGFTGGYEHFESVFVLLGYCMVAYYAYITVSTERDVKKLVTWLAAGVCVMIFIGFTQAFATDFYQTEIGKRLIAPSELLEIGGLSFSFEKGRVYLSVYNPNYVGSYVALIMPIFVVLAFFRRELGKRILFGLIAIGLLMCMFGSQSRTGLLCMGAAFLVLLVILRSKIVQYWRISLITGISLAAAVVLFFIFSDGSTLWQRITTMFETTETQSGLEDIYTNDDNVEIVYNGEHIFITYTYEPDTGLVYIYAKDASGETFPMHVNDDMTGYVMDDENLPIELTGSLFEANEDYGYPEAGGVSVNMDGMSFGFTNQIDGTYQIWTSTGKYDKISHPEKAVFTDIPSFGSGRGFIWSRSIPLLKKHLLLGSGADTFIIEYPNDEYAGMLLNGYDNMIISKPHNMYLQIGVQSGVLALLCMLTYFVLYFIDCFRVFWKNKFENYLSWAGLGIFIGVLGYVITGIANDSTVSVAPIFWVMTGVGFAINRELKAQKNS